MVNNINIFRGINKTFPKFPKNNYKVPTMVGFWEKSQKIRLLHHFGQNLVGFLSLWRNLEEFSRNSEIYLHDSV